MISYSELKQLYLVDKLDWEEIALKLRCSKSTVGRALRKSGILSSRYDLRGKRFGKLKAVKIDGKHPRNHRELWLCNCDCGTQHHVLASNLTSGRIKSCGCDKLIKGTVRQTWKACGEISLRRMSKIRSGAKQRGIDFDSSIDAEWLWSLYLQQNRRCSLSGIEIKFDKNYLFNTASLDRIDSNKGYVKDNVQWIHKDINTMKWNFNQDYFIRLCKAVCTNVN